MVHLACGFQHCVALTAEARVFIWGAAGFSHHTPVALNPASPPALPAERAVRAVAAGTNYSAAVLADGSALTWGQNRWAPRPPAHQRAAPPEPGPAAPCTPRVAAASADPRGLVCAGTGHWMGCRSWVAQANSGTRAARGGARSAHASWRACRESAPSRAGTTTPPSSPSDVEGHTSMP